MANDDKEIQLQVPVSQIVMSDNGADLVTGKDLQNANSVKPALHDVKSILQEQPQALPVVTPPEIEVDSTNPKDISNIIKGLLTKSAKIGLDRLLVLIERMDKTSNPETLLTIVMRLLDAHMALDWSERFEKAILKNPNYMAANKTAGGLSTMIQGKAGTLTKLIRGDQRTTPKRLLNNMPKDEEVA